MAEQAAPEGGPRPAPVVIKKYANRRLYNTATSAYVTLDHLSQMVKDKTEIGRASCRERVLNLV